MTLIRHQTAQTTILRESASSLLVLRQRTAACKGTRSTTICTVFSSRTTRISGAQNGKSPLPRSGAAIGFILQTQSPHHFKRKEHSLAGHHCFEVVCMHDCEGAQPDQHNMHMPIEALAELETAPAFGP